MELLQRDLQLKEIQGALEGARQGYGSTVLVSGEAGSGKTIFVTEFSRPFQKKGLVFWGACDPLFTPRPLGPLYDIALEKQPGLLELLNKGVNWLDAALELLKVLRDVPEPGIVVFEDVHWADEATLDLLKYVGRRVNQTHSLLVLTYRDSEVSGRHPLRGTLGDLPAASTVRIQLEPFSQETVAWLAKQAGHPVEGLYEATRGNPFFVTEVLCSKDERIPATVRDAVLSRAAHLTAPARELLDLASLIPGPAPLWLLVKILPGDPSAIDACIDAGFLIPDSDELAFKHELARLAISQAVPFHRSRGLHHKILQTLLESVSGGPTFLRGQASSIPLALFVHHALGAEDGKMVLEYAPAAAQEASRHGAHREAARQYQTALRYSNLLTAEKRTDLIDSLSYEYYLTGQIDPAIQLRQEAIQSWRKLERLERVGDDLRWLSRLYWFHASKKEAEQFADEAIEVLEQLPPGRDLAMAFSNRSQLYMLKSEYQTAISWGERALKLAELIQDDSIIVHALTNIGSAEILSGDENGLLTLERALTMAKEQEMHDDAARCLTNLASNAVIHRDYRSADDYLNQGIRYVAGRDMDSYHIYMRGWRARMLFELGKWAEAAQEAEDLLSLKPGSTITAFPAVAALASVRMRQGDAGACGLLDQARDIAIPSGELQRIGPVAAARAEAAWWEGNRAQVLEEVSLAYELANQLKDMWPLGEMMVWSWRAGGEVQHVNGIPLCYQAIMDGDWRTAAAEWERIGCPYEQAMALAGGDQQAQFAALAIFEQLGARPAAKALRENMRLEGVKGLPRGPRPGTKANPEGLTAREMEILALLAEGLSNAEIASKLSISMKTVDHHVSMVLAKLGVHSRLEAAAVAHQKNLFPRA